MKTHADNRQGTSSPSTDNPAARNRSGSKATASILDRRPDAFAQAISRVPAINSGRAKQLATFQEMADRSPQVQRAQQLQVRLVANSRRPIQRYTTSEAGFLVSENDRIVLKRDHSKELYAKSDSIRGAQGELEAKKVTNLELGAGGDWRFADADYQQVVPKFKGHAGTKLTSKPQVQKDLGDAKERLYGTFALGWMYTLNFLSSCSKNPWYRDQLKDHKDALGDQGKAESAFSAIAAMQKRMQEAVDILREIQSDIDDNAEKTRINAKVTGDMGKLSAIGWDLLEKLILYSSGDDIARVSILREVEQRVRQLDTDIAGIDNDSPYLPTSCGDLKNYLLKNSDAIENGGQVGDYHYIDYSKDDTEHGPWQNHFATIALKDGNDTVTLEDAAGQAEPNEKSHWYFVMYGSQKGQSFEEKTNAEYHRRAEQRAKVIEAS